MAASLLFHLVVFGVTAGMQPGARSSATREYLPVDLVQLPDYHRLDVRFAREFIFDKWKLAAYLDIINAYANQNVSGYGYNGDYTSRKKITQLPLMPAQGIRGEF